MAKESNRDDVAAALPRPPINEDDDDDYDYDTDAEEEVIRLSSECTVRSLKQQIAERLGHPIPEESNGGYWSAIKESIAMHKRRPARLRPSKSKKRVKNDDTRTVPPRCQEEADSAHKRQDLAGQPPWELRHTKCSAVALWCLIMNIREINACIVAERDALVAFNASINDHQGRLSSWQGENCCNWSGVRCRKKTGHVVQLDLGEYSLKGELNPSLASLTSLVYLNLSQNDFGGVSIPEFIGSFKMLRYLDLSHAGFGGTVPPQLRNLSRLGYLDLSSSGSHVITVDSFHWVSKLTSLSYLDLSWLYLAASSDWLQAVNMLPLLQVLHLNDASLPATNLNYLPRVNFTTLTQLDLKNNNLNSSFPSWIWNLSVLSELDMSSCGLSGRIPDEIGKLTSLKFIGLADNKLEGVIPRSATRLCNAAARKSYFQFTDAVLINKVNIAMDLKILS
ncbi:hypothetical protein PR202_gb02495 [Eleusine coracana subsp. coracana]|uniref:Leucine-rich repeat-containing N-terminal plant-type domain-containing protein n=1 Tax=Eleusine coracana subsp. coracana TaxID=191504 RepID=A0AAV5DYP0_ELECO|nr:hypothetical protein PR202_gb02495 [Eleusine coracana subsp. coracana]